MTTQSKLIKALLVKAQRLSKNIDFEKFKNELTEAYLIRQVELKFIQLFTEAKISGTVHTCVGQELTGVVLSKFLNGEDWVTSNHRCHGHYIARTKDWKGLVDELIGLEAGVSKGIGSSQHLFNAKFISNGTQGSLLPVATGLGISAKRRQSDGIAVSFIGEGTLGEGVVYEAFNLASIFESPQLVVCENNYYSQTTPQSAGVSGQIIDRPKSFGWKVFETTTWDLEDLHQVASEAVEYVRTRKKPAFLKIDTYRLLAHSKGDDDRADDEVSKFVDVDLVNNFVSSNLFDEELISIKNEINVYVEERLVDPKKISYDEYKTDQLPRSVSLKQSNIQNDTISMVKALSRSYRSQLEKKDAVFIGEDIADPYGGAFKVTKGFQTTHPENVLSTSISEAGLVGLAIGMNLDGNYTFAEIMFGDFIVNAMDQIINNASKFYHMYGNQISLDVVIRTPMGGRRGYGPTHSQSLEKFLLGIDNTLVAAFSSLVDPDPLIKALPNFRCPKILIENKTDYSSFLYKPGDDLTLDKVGGPFGTLKLSPNGGKTQLLIIAYGYVARLIADNYLKIFTESDCVFTLMCPQLLHPIPVPHFERISKKTKRVLLVEESTAGFGWADGVAASLSRSKENVQISILSSDPVPIPSNREIEALNLVSVDKIIREIKLMKEIYG